jgi:hypothetical protein
MFDLKRKLVNQYKTIVNSHLAAKGIGTCIAAIRN